MLQRISLLIGAVALLSSCSVAEPQGGFTDNSEAQKIAAAQSTAVTNTDCASIAPFYWEIGNVSAVITSGSTGDNSFTRTTDVSVGSATKWLFGAYVLQYRGGAPSSADIPLLTMTSGYTNFALNSCQNANTVGDCFAAGTNSNQTAANVGKFFYNGGHFQAWGNNIGGLASSGLVALSSTFRTTLGSNTQVTFASPQLAGGAYMNAGEYAEFLRRIISGQLIMKNYLGANAVCTLPGSPNCNAVSSPIPLAFHYSYGHWVEDDSTGDGAYSSAGIFGFYPWISKDKRLYGLISRSDQSPVSDEVGHGYDSYLCGKAIRKAYVTGTAQ